MRAWTKSSICRQRQCDRKDLHISFSQAIKPPYISIDCTDSFLKEFAPLCGVFCKNAFLSCHNHLQQDFLSFLHPVGSMALHLHCLIRVFHIFLSHTFTGAVSRSIKSEMSCSGFSASKTPSESVSFPIRSPNFSKIFDPP